MSDIGPESTLLGYSAFALGMALSAPLQTIELQAEGQEIEKYVRTKQTALVCQELTVEAEALAVEDGLA
ncbi:MAG TPA: hypothetical protein VE687_08060 [Stellaceae bacterium]|nr:hypothetical protein [Stellaceae bacterium]